MDENLIEMTTEETVAVEFGETAYDIAVEDTEQEIEINEAPTSIEVDAVEEIEIEVDEVVGWVGGDNTRHHSLFGRDEPNQHPITAIAGLRQELDDIEALKTVCADKIGVANYYKWYDGVSYDEFGYFVNLAPHTSSIKICDGSDIFGVTVDTAGFVGGQDAANPRDNTYGLVVTSGLVDVRCESDVAEGDYVVSNSNGIAKKTTTNYGYKVIAKEIKHGITYAVVSLDIQACTTDLIGKAVQHLDGRMGAAEINITSATNLANQAYSKSTESDKVSQDAVLKALEALNKAEGASNVANQASENMGSVQATAAQARAIAESAATSAESIRESAYKAANDAWAKAEEVQTEMNSLCAHIDKYVVGELSQAYGLTLEQARSILKKDMIYIPLRSAKDGEPIYAHTESYAYTDDNGESQNVETTFSSGFYYIWDGFQWIESYTKCVALPYVDELGNNIPAGGDAIEFWFIDSDTAPDGYEPMALYKWTKITTESGDVWQWEKVNTLAGNTSSRIASMIRQDVDSITAEVVNAHGSVAGFGAWLKDTESIAKMGTFWVDPSSGEKTMANIGLQSNDDGSSMSLIVRKQDGEDTVLRGAGIVLNQDDGGSSIVLDADQIVANGEMFFTSEEGETRIDGSKIVTGSITAEQIDADSIAAKILSADNIIAINANIGDLAAGTIDASKVTVTNIDASNITAGEIDANIITVKNIDANNITAGILKSTGYTDTNTNDVYSDSGTAIDLDTGYIRSKHFAVTNTGDAYFRSGQIGQFKVADGIMDMSSTSPNLLLSADRIITNTGYQVTQYRVSAKASKDDSQIWTLSNGKKVGYLVSGQTYTVQLDIEADAEVGLIGLYHGDSNAYIMTADDGGWIKIAEENKGKRHIITRTFKCRTFTPASVNEAYIKIYRRNSKDVIGSGQVTIYRIKIEEGSVATGFNDLLKSTSADDEMNWSITPSECVWWNENTTRDNPLMKLDGTGLSFDNGRVVIRDGHLGADSGDLGAWNFSVNNGFWGEYYGGTGFSDAINVYLKPNKLEYKAENISTGETNERNVGWVTVVNVCDASTSDARFKNSIETLPEQYDKLFDLLAPKRYRYNNGSSHRYHTGYIAQEVVSALEQAGLSTHDFAAVMLENPGAEDECWKLRRDEFVALNTWQIQKLKNRVNELEQKNKELEERLNKIEALIDANNTK